VSVGLRLFTFAMRWGVRPLLSRTGRVGAARWGLRLAALAFPLPFGLVVSRQRGEWRLRPRSAGAGPVVLYFHGGAYIAGSPWTHRGLLGRIARAAGCEVVAPDYPLAPEHPAPAAFKAAQAAFDHLRAEGHPAAQIILAGDSAGGGLAAALANDLANQGCVVGGLILLSPWADLTLSGASIGTKAKIDPLLPAHRLQEVVKHVCGELSPEDPRLSALFGHASSAPRTLILVGADEILLDDSRRLAVHLRAKGALVDLHIRLQAPHVYPYLAPYVPEARAAIRHMARFIRQVSPSPQSRFGS
jgi:monoterpene epsilon-lactone hydrolase